MGMTQQRLWILLTCLVSVLGKVSPVSNDLDCNRGIIFCHWQSWSHNRSSPFTYTVEDIPVHLCTHLVYSYAKVSASSGLDHLDAHFDKEQGGYESFVSLKGKNPHLKLLLAIGDPSGNDDAFTLEEKSGQRRFLLDDNDSRKYQLLKKLTKLVQKHELDGIHLNWQNLRGSTENRLNFPTFAWRVKRLFRWKPGFIISCSVPAYADDLETIYDLRTFPRIFTFIIASPRGLPPDISASNHTPSFGASKEKEKYLVGAGIPRLLRSGIPSDKVLVEIPFYGRTRMIENTQNVNTGRGTWKIENGTDATEMSPYFEICNNLKRGWRRIYNPVLRRPEAFHSGRRVVYDDEESIHEIVQHVKHYNIGGVVAWGIDMDDVNDNCVRKNHLLKSINEELNGCPVPTDSPGESKDTARIAVSWPVTVATPTVTAMLGDSESTEGVGARKSSTMSHDDVPTTEKDAMTPSATPAQLSSGTGGTVNELETRTETVFSTTSGKVVPSGSTHNSANTEGPEGTSGVRASIVTSSTAPWSSFTVPSEINTASRTTHDSEGVTASTTTNEILSTALGTNEPGYTNDPEPPARFSTTGSTVLDESELRIESLSSKSYFPTSSHSIFKDKSAGVPEMSTQSDGYPRKTPEASTQKMVATTNDGMWTKGDTPEVHPTTMTNTVLPSDSTSDSTTESVVMSTSSVNLYTRTAAQSDAFPSTDMPGEKVASPSSSPQQTDSDLTITSKLDTVTPSPPREVTKLSITKAPHDDQYSTSVPSFPATTIVPFSRDTASTTPPTAVVEATVNPFKVCRDEKTDGFAHESDCNLYYSCRRGVATLRKCPDGLVYDGKLRECNNLEHVQRPECKSSQKAHRVNLIRLLKSVVSDDFTPKKGEMIKVSLNYELIIGK